METNIKKDLSILTRKEKSIIQGVLHRDAVLRKREEKRIRKMKANTDPPYLKLITGEWFDDLRSDRYIKYSSATDLIKCAFQEKHGIGLLTSTGRKWLSNTRLRLKPVQKTFNESGRQHIESLKRKTENVPSPHPGEEISISEILKDLEIILEKELESNDSRSDTANISGFGPENGMLDKMPPVDYNKHHFWHYSAPTHLSPIKEESASTISLDPSTNTESNVPGVTPDTIFDNSGKSKLSPVESNNKVMVKYISASAYRRITGDKLHSMHTFNFKARVSKFKDSEINKPLSFEYPGFTNVPFCSSPFEHQEMDIFQKYEVRDKDALHGVSNLSNESSMVQDKQDAQNGTDFDWSSVDTDVTIEQSTILANNSTDHSSRTNIDENLQCIGS